MAVLAGSQMTDSRRRLRIVAFRSLSTLPLLAAQQQSSFAKRGLVVEIEYASQSLALRRGLAAGSYDIAQTAADNAVAMVENDGTDVVIVTGGDNGFNSLIVQPDLHDLTAFRGRSLVVDAPDTGFALVAYQILQNAGLTPSDYTVTQVGSSQMRLREMLQDPATGGAILGLPFSLQAVESGLRNAGAAVDLIGPYLSSVTFVRRDWLADNSDQLISYVAAHIEGLRWVLDRANKSAVVALIASSLAVSPKQAAESYRQAMNGFTKDAAFDLAGFEKVLNLRASFGSLARKQSGPVGKYVDLTCWKLAQAQIDYSAKDNLQSSESVRQR